MVTFADDSYTLYRMRRYETSENYYTFLFNNLTAAIKAVSTKINNNYFALSSRHNRVHG